MMDTSLREYHKTCDMVIVHLDDIKQLLSSSKQSKVYEKMPVDEMVYVYARLTDSVRELNTLLELSRREIMRTFEKKSLLRYTQPISKDFIEIVPLAETKVNEAKLALFLSKGEVASVKEQTVRRVLRCVTPFQRMTQKKDAPAKSLIIKRD